METTESKSEVKGAAYIGTGKVLHPVTKTENQGLLFHCPCHNNRSIGSRVRFITGALANCKKS